MGEELFRFVVVRPADRRSGLAADLRQESKFQSELRQTDGVSTALDVVLRDFVRGKVFLEHLTKDPLGARFAAVDRALSVRTPSAEQIRRAILEQFTDPSAELSRTEWKTLRSRLADTLVAHAYARQPPPGELAVKARVFRLVNLVERWAVDPELSDEEVRSLVAAPLLLGDLPARKQPAPTKPPAPPTTTPPPPKEPLLLAALDELGRIPVSSFARTQPVGATVTQPDAIRVIRTNPTEALTLTPAGVRLLSSATQATLREFGLDPSTTPVPRMMLELRHARRNELLQLAPSLVGRGFLGRLYWMDPSLVGESGQPVPTSVGELRRLGVGDLLLVRQRLLRYESVDVAHIENVLAGETKLREHRRRRVTDEFFEREAERTVGEEQEFASTDRFELSTEVTETVREEFEVRGGLRVKASYGPSVEIEAHADVGYSTASERARKAATQIGREIVQKSVARVEEKVRTLESRRIVEEVEERNHHTLTNPDATPRRGVYQWVTKVYEAQTYNYGEREMYEFDVPEPGAYLLKTLAETVEQRTGLKPPPTFTLRPDDIAEGTYQRHAATYGATGDVSAPPDDWVVRTSAFTHEDPGEGSRPAGIAKQEQVAVGDGWEAVYALVTTLNHGASQLFCTVGPHIFDFSIVSGVQGGPLASEDGVGYVGSLRVGLIARDPLNALVTVHLLCRPTERARENWRLETYEAIRQAHARAVREYEDALAAQAVSVGIKLPERGVEEGRRLAADELRKACISIATAQHFDAFGAVETDAGGRPQVHFDRAREQGPYARFFEQAFEWENMQFVLYPYFWGRKSFWDERARITLGSNPELSEFLKAGSARVVVPVREGFRASLEHFRRTGQPFGGDGVEMGDEDFLEISEEIRARTDRDYGNAAPVDEPWLVHVPTSLVWVRDDGALPAWEPSPR